MIEFYVLDAMKGPRYNGDLGDLFDDMNQWFLNTGIAYDLESRPVGGFIRTRISFSDPTDAILFKVTWL